MEVLYRTHDKQKKYQKAVDTNKAAFHLHKPIADALFRPVTCCTELTTVAVEEAALTLILRCCCCLPLATLTWAIQLTSFLIGLKYWPRVMVGYRLLNLARTAIAAANSSFGIIYICIALLFPKREFYHRQPPQMVNTANSKALSIELQPC